MENLLGVVLELYRLAQQTPLSEFHELALALLRSVVLFRSATWSSAAVDTRGAVDIFSVHLHNQPTEVRLQFAALNRKFTRRVLVAARQPGSAHVIEDTYAYFRRPDEQPMRAYMRRYEHDQNLLITDHKEWLSLYRGRADETFTARETAIVNALLPHLVEALKINRAIALGTRGVDRRGPSSPAYAVIRRDGTFLHCGQQFRELLRREWPDWCEPRLPAGLLAKLSSGVEAYRVADTIEISAQAFGDAVLLTGRERSPLARLSPRELEITRHFGSGKSYKAIAIETQLAPATVRNVLQKVYRKLDIDNKAALAHLLRLHEG